MSTVGGPDIVTDGLRFFVDAANPLSYPGSGNTWSDLSPNSLDGELTNTPTFSGVVRAPFFSFNGTDEYVALPSNTMPSSFNYTKAVWFRISSYSTPNNIFSGGGSVGQHAFWMAGTQYLNAGHNGSWSTVTSTSAIPLNSWTFGAVSFSTTTGWKLYVDENLEDTDASTTTFTLGFGANLGEYISGNLLTGSISQAYLYDRPLTDSEILLIYNSTKSRFGK